MASPCVTERAATPTVAGNGLGWLGRPSRPRAPAPQDRRDAGQLPAVYGLDALQLLTDIHDVGDAGSVHDQVGQPNQLRDDDL